MEEAEARSDGAEMELPKLGRSRVTRVVVPPSCNRKGHICQGYYTETLNVGTVGQGYPNPSSYPSLPSGSLPG